MGGRVRRLKRGYARHPRRLKCEFGDHYWIWYPPEGIGSRRPKYCPEHRHQAKGAGVAKTRALYGKLPLPEDKKCGKCGKVKPAWAFYTVKGPKKKDGTRTVRLYTYCRVCTKNIQKKRRSGVGGSQRGSL